MRIFVKINENGVPLEVTEIQDDTAIQPDGWLNLSLEEYLQYQKDHVPRVPDPVNSDFDPISPRQFRLSLLNNGISPSVVENAIETLPPQMAERARIEWEFASEFRRENILLNQLASVLGVDHQTIDKIFREGVTL